MLPIIVAAVLSLATVWMRSPEAGGKRLKIATGSVRITSHPPTLFS